MTSGVEAAVLRQAIDWYALLRSGETDASTRQRFMQWRHADLAHEAACAHLDRSLDAMTRLRRHGMTPEMVDGTLRAAACRGRRRVVLGFSGIGIGATTWGLWQAENVGMLADARTGVAERQQLTVADGSRLWLDAGTSLDTHVSVPRHMRLHHGRLLADLSSDGTAPWRIDTPLGQLTGLGGRILLAVRGVANGLRASALSGGFDLIQPSRPPIRIEAGQEVLLVDGQLRRRAARETDTLWTRGQIALDNEPLSVLIDALGPYRHGILRADQRAAALRISGVFSLDDTDRTLNAIGASHPLRIVRRSDYWVVVESR